MRIAQVAPLYESVPPKGYGGTERVVSYLTEELVRQGHEVTLYATADSSTTARLISPWHEGLRLGGVRDSLACHVLLTDIVMNQAPWYDVMHFHHDHLHLPHLARAPVPIIATAHGRLDLPELVPLFRRFRRMPMISISDAQREPLPWLNWRATIHHGLPRELFHAGTGRGGYLAVLARLSPEKGVDKAIQLALTTGIPVKVAAKIEPDIAREYVESVRALFDHPLVEYVGEIGEAEKQTFLGDAMALVMLGDWPEPFGITVIEALACGTPVIGLRRGSIPALIDDGETGILVEEPEEAVRRIGEIGQVSRQACRSAFEARFTAERMARDHLAVYASLIAGRSRPAAAARIVANALAVADRTPALGAGATRYRGADDGSTSVN